jgi:hypothetical protein
MKKAVPLHDTKEVRDAQERLNSLKRRLTALERELADAEEAESALVPDLDAQAAAMLADRPPSPPPKAPGRPSRAICADLAVARRSAELAEEALAAEVQSLSSKVCRAAEAELKPWAQSIADKLWEASQLALRANELYEVLVAGGYRRSGLQSQQDHPERVDELCAAILDGFDLRLPGSALTVYVKKLVGLGLIDRKHPVAIAAAAAG